MKRALLVACLSCVAGASFAGASSWQKMDEALAELARRSGTTVGRLRVDPAASALVSDRIGTLRLQRYLMAEPQRAPATVEAMNRDLSNSKGVSPRLEVLTQLSWDRPAVQRPLVMETVRLPDDRTSNPVVDAMKRLYAGTGRRFQGKDRTRVIDDSRRFPPELQTHVGALIDAVSVAHRMRESVVKSSALKQGGLFEAKSKKTADRVRDFLTRWWEPGLATDTQLSRLIFALETFDLDALYAGAIPLARSLDQASVGLSGLNTQSNFHSDWETPLGRIAVGGTGNDNYDGEFTLIVDLGGNDRYRGAGAASGKDPVSLVLDLGGDDRYAARDSALAGPGGAVLGYAGIVDAGTGKDSYEATSWAGGFGCLGVGWIEDQGGDDTYRMQFMSQGSALFGMGLLLDEEGEDQFTLAFMDSAFAIGQSEGFGGPLGIGALVDLQGNDVYMKADSWSGPQDWVQGAAWGGAWSGGFGWLIDAGSGNDTYRAKLNAQGAGADCGLGLLVDDGGDDEYWSEYQSQGFGGWQGMGIVYDGAGNDRYRARHKGMGFGMDLGMGMLLEGSGDDVYFVTPLGLSEEEIEDSLNVTPTVASSEREGAGWLLDMEGNDVYPKGLQTDSKHSSVSWRSPVPGVSVFIDAGQPGTEVTYTPCSGEGPAVGGMLVLPSGAATKGGPP